MKNQLAESIHMEFNDNSVLSSLFGVSDSNIQLLEKINNVKIEYRGNIVKISGNKLSIQETKLSLEKLFDEAKKGIEIDEDKIQDIKSLLTLDIDDDFQTRFFYSNKKKENNTSLTKSKKIILNY